MCNYAEQANTHSTFELIHCRHLPTRGRFRKRKIKHVKRFDTQQRRGFAQAAPPRHSIFEVLETRLFQPCNTRVVFEKVTCHTSTGTDLILIDASQKRSFMRVLAMPLAYRALFSEF